MDFRKQNSREKRSSIQIELGKNNRESPFQGLESYDLRNKLRLSVRLEKELPETDVI